MVSLNRPNPIDDAHMYVRYKCKYLGCTVEHYRFKPLSPRLKKFIASMVVAQEMIKEADWMIRHPVETGVVIGFWNMIFDLVHKGESDG